MKKKTTKRKVAKKTASRDRSSARTKKRPAKKKAASSRKKKTTGKTSLVGTVSRSSMVRGKSAKKEETPLEVARLALASFDAGNLNRVRISLMKLVRQLSGEG